MRSMIRLAALGGTVLMLASGCSGSRALTGAELEAAQNAYVCYASSKSLEESLDWADAVIQVEVLHRNALPEPLAGQSEAVPVHVEQAICGSVADSSAVNDRATAVLWAEAGCPALKEGQKLILAVRERMLDEGDVVFDYTAGLFFYLYEDEYLIAATDDNASSELNGQTLERLTEKLWPLFHPGQTQFTRSTLNATEWQALVEASPFVRNEAGERMDYGRLRELLRACDRDVARLDLMVVQAGGRLALVEELYPGGGERLQRLPEALSDLPEGTRLIVGQGQAIYGLNDSDQLICLVPEAQSFTLTGTTLQEFTGSLEKIAP